MLDNPKIARGPSVIMSWLYVALVLGAMYSMFRWVLPGGQYIVQLPGFLIMVATPAALMIFGEIHTTASIRSRNAIRQAAAGGDDMRTETVIAIADTQVYHLPLHVSRTYQAKSMVNITLFYAFFGMLCLGVVWYFGLRNWLVTHHPLSNLDLTLTIMFAVFFVVMIHGILNLLNSSRHTIVADYQGLTIRRRWTKQYMRWQDVRLFWYVAPHFKTAPIADAAAFTAAGAPLGSYELASAKRSVTVLAEAINLCFDDPETYPTRLREILTTAVRLSNVPLRQVSRGGVLAAARQAPFAWARPSRLMRVRIIRFRRFCKKYGSAIAITIFCSIFLIPLTAMSASSWLFTANGAAAQAQVVAIHPCVGKKDSADDVTLTVQYQDHTGQQHTAQSPSCVVHPEHVGDIIIIRYWPNDPSTIQMPWEINTSGPLFGFIVGTDLFELIAVTGCFLWLRRKARAATAAKQQVAQLTVAS